MNERRFFVHILASGRNGTLYVGVTFDIGARVEHHRKRVVGRFTRDHGIDRLVWYEVHDTTHAAITREKQLKPWNRAWKVRLIETENPYWNDLAAKLV